MYAKVNGTWRFILVLVFLIGLLVPVSMNVRADTVITNPNLPTTFAWPSWWTGTWGTNDCNGSVFNPYYSGDPDASVMQTWRGIQACAPQPQNQGGQDVPESNFPGVGQHMFQCTELAARYLDVAYGIPSLQANGGQFADYYGHDSTYGSKFAYYVNGTDNVLPQEGDVVSMTSSDSNGHVAIVTSLTVSDGNPGDATISLMDQNGSPNGTFSMTISNYVIQDESQQGLGFHATDWIHPLVGIDNSPTYSTTTEITSIANVDRTRAWITGMEQPSGINKQPITFYYNGSSWAKYSPPSQGSYQHHYLYDIAIGSDGMVWTVGTFYSYPRWNTLVYKLDMTVQPQSSWTWTKKNSQNYGTTNDNQLNSVAIDGAGGIWAVGQYWNSGYQPLMLKWNRDANTFQSQTVTLPTGVTSGYFTDVSFSSSTNGWAVGSFGGYVYHWNGSSWSWVAIPTGALAILHVTAVSDSEAWGASYYSQNSVWASHLFHYTSANGWQVDTSFTFPSGSAALYSIASDNSHDIWAAGSNLIGSSSEPYFIRYDGSAWHSVAAQTYTYPSKLEGVSVYGGYVWAAGIKSSSSSWATPWYPIVLVK